ncbi:MAG: metallophosphoesterase [Ectothiorhodospiraceae bacterium]|jgi:predicted MPP superfamily phosphohydrolase
MRATTPAIAGLGSLRFRREANATMSQAVRREEQTPSLTERVDRIHLRQRLGIEREGEAPVFGRGRTVFHPENVLSFYSILRGLLRVSGLYGRGQRNARRIRLVHNDLTVPGLPAGLEGLRLLQIADPHLDSHPEYPAALAECVHELDYDICVLTGDYRFRTTGAMEPALDGLSRLRACLGDPVYAILGNHDSIHMVPPLEEMGIQLLLNEAVGIERNGDTLYIAGVDDPHFFRADNLEKACRDIPENAPSILLAHSPEIFRQAASCGFGAMLCGHTHGGQIRLPGGVAVFTNVDCPRRFAAGNWRFRQLHGYTSLGAGSSIVDVRFNCPPEVVIHTLRDRGVQ